MFIQHQSRRCTADWQEPRGAFCRSHVSGRPGTVANRSLVDAASANMVHYGGVDIGWSNIDWQLMITNQMVSEPDLPWMITIDHNEVYSHDLVLNSLWSQVFLKIEDPQIIQFIDHIVINHPFLWNSPILRNRQVVMTAMTSFSGKSPRNRSNWPEISPLFAAWPQVLTPMNHHDSPLNTLVGTIIIMVKPSWFATVSQSFLSFLRTFVGQIRMGWDVQPLVTKRLANGYPQ